MDPFSGDHSDMFFQTLDNANFEFEYILIDDPLSTPPTSGSPIKEFPPSLDISNLQYEYITPPTSGGPIEDFVPSLGNANFGINSMCIEYALPTQPISGGPIEEFSPCLDIGHIEYENITPPTSGGPIEDNNSNIEHASSTPPSSGGPIEDVENITIDHALTPSSSGGTIEEYLQLLDTPNFDYDMWVDRALTTLDDGCFDVLRACQDELIKGIEEDAKSKESVGAAPVGPSRACQDELIEEVEDDTPVDPSRACQDELIEEVEDHAPIGASRACQDEFIEDVEDDAPVGPVGFQIIEPPSRGGPSSYNNGRFRVHNLTPSQRFTPTAETAESSADSNGERHEGITCYAMLWASDEEEDEPSEVIDISSDSEESTRCYFTK